MATRNESGVADREADAVDGHGALLHGAEAAAAGFVAEGEVPTAVGVLAGGADGGLVDVSLNDMSVEQGIGFHRAFEIDQIADAEQPEVAAVEGLLHGRNGVGIPGDVHHRQTNAVMCYALINFELGGKGRPERKILVLPVRPDRHDLGRTLHDA